MELLTGCTFIIVQTNYTSVILLAVADGKTLNLFLPRTYTDKCWTKSESNLKTFKPYRPVSVRLSRIEAPTFGRGYAANDDDGYHGRTSAPKYHKTY
jgi:hypothetical protein